MQYELLSFGFTNRWWLLYIIDTLLLNTIRHDVFSTRLRKDWLFPEISGVFMHPMLHESILFFSFNEKIKTKEYLVPYRMEISQVHFDVAKIHLIIWTSLMSIWDTEKYTLSYGNLTSQLGYTKNTCYLMAISQVNLDAPKIHVIHLRGCFIEIYEGCLSSQYRRMEIFLWRTDFYL